jgi:hypothetical protein
MAEDTLALALRVAAILVRVHSWASDETQLDLLLCGGLRRDEKHGEAYQCRAGWWSMAA